MKLRPTWLQLDESALENNINLLKNWNGPAFFCPMVKANAYGHGDLTVARILEKNGVKAVGVALFEEGIRLRENGIQMQILCFAPMDAASAKAAHEYKITPILERLEDVAVYKEGVAHLKFNTGMNRLGFDPNEFDKLKAALASSKIEIEATCTHFTHGEDIASDGPSRRQLAALTEINKIFPAKFSHIHKSASLATLAREGLKKTDPFGARPGIALYGLAHDPGLTGPGLQPVLSWHTRLFRVHDVQKGEAVSYGATWVAPRRSTIGVVSVGYGDGYMRSLSNKGEMLFRNRRVPVVGRVCMDYTLLDLTNGLEEGIAQSGEEVTIFGTQGKSQISAEEVAEKAGTIVYELVTGIRGRVAREGYDPGLERQSSTSQRRD